MTWDGVGCAGAPVELPFDDAVTGCADLNPDYRLPTLSELALLLGDCSGEAEEARCRPCADSVECSETLAAEDISAWTWTADEAGSAAFVVEVAAGRIAYEPMTAEAIQARCVRPR